MRIMLRSQEPFAFAGLWDTWTPQQGETIHSCNIITTESNEVLKSIHDRMPVILPREQEELWLESKITDPNMTLPLLKPYPSHLMKMYPVSKMVNSPAHEAPDCIEPIK
jgi:putative SOS response-associated peptidase YedK